MKESVEGGFAGANGIGGGKTGEVGLRSHPLSSILHPTSAFMPTHCKWSMHQLDLACPAAQACAAAIFLCGTYCGRQYETLLSWANLPWVSSTHVLGAGQCNFCCNHAALHRLSSKQKLLSIIASASFNLPAQTAR